jgi:hypothetical protein
MTRLELYSDYEDLDRHSPDLLSAHSTTSKGISELITAGVVWHGNYRAVDNLWKNCSKPVESINFNVPEIDSALSSGGLLCGAIHEFYYNDPTGNIRTTIALPTLLARNAIDAYYESPASTWERPNSGAPPFFIAWIGRRSWPTPFAIPQHLLASCLFIDPPTQKLTLWAIETALRSPLIKLVIADCPRIPLITTKRLSLYAKTAGSTGILLRAPQDMRMASSSATKWSITSLPSDHFHPVWNLTLERNKGGALPNASWTITVESSYEERETISLRVLPRVVDTDHEETFKAQRYG